ncbi:MAG: helix-turn-helix domain-containing protein, partial [Planctomycetaceae bacterium]|nr:helix-turn-helix domain-containing protein [Planctomycetaceae bacterium]
MQTALVEQLEARRIALGMTREILAKRSRLSVPAVNKILQNQIETASRSTENSIQSLAETLGVQTSESGLETISVGEMRFQQARLQAERLVRILQGTSGLEGQALGQNDLEDLIAVSIKLSEEERTTLTRWARGRRTENRIVQRAKIVLAAADGKQ